MDENQKVLYLTNKMCNRISEMKIDLNVIKNFNPDNKEDFTKVMTAKLDLEDYLKELHELKESIEDLNNKIQEDNFILKNIVSNNTTIICNKITEFLGLKASIESLINSIKVNKNLIKRQNK